MDGSREHGRGMFVTLDFGTNKETFDGMIYRGVPVTLLYYFTILLYYTDEGLLGSTHTRTRVNYNYCST